MQNHRCKSTKSMLARYEKHNIGRNKWNLCLVNLAKHKSITVFDVQLRNISHAHVGSKIWTLTLSLKMVCSFKFSQICHSLFLLSAQFKGLCFKKWGEKNFKKMTKLGINFCAFSLLTRTFQLFALFGAILDSKPYFHHCYNCKLGMSPPFVWQHRMSRNCV